MPPSEKPPKSRWQKARDGTINFLRNRVVVWLWSTYAVPVVLTALFIATSWITGVHGPWIVLGAIATFAVGSFGAAAIEHQRYLREARTRLVTGQPVPMPTLPTKSLLRREAPPRINVTPYDGEEAILMVHNSGGDAVFSAEGQIRASWPGTSVTRR